MDPVLIILLAVFLIAAAILFLAFWQRQRIARWLFQAPIIGRRLQAQAAREISADPEKLLEQQELSGQQRRALQQVVKGREPEEVEELINKALSGQALSAQDLQRPVGSGKMNNKRVAARRKKNRQARQARKRGRK